MANWSNPTLTSLYTDFVTEVKNRDVDLALGLDPATTSPTNVPTNAIRWNSASFKYQKWDGSTWNDLSAKYIFTAVEVSGATVPTNGMYLSTTNTLNFSTASTASRLTIDGSGNVNIDSGTFYVDAVNNRVGVGTTGPSSPLHVYSVGNTELLIGGTQTPILNLIGGAGTDPVIGYGVGALRFGTTTGAGAAGFSEKMTLDASGNLGLGVVPAVGYGKEFSISAGTTSGVGGLGVRNLAIGNNVVYLANNTQNTGAFSDSYWTSSPATKYAQNQGNHYWYTAPSGTAGAAITFTQAMTLDASGRLGLGTTTPGVKVDIVSENNTSLDPVLRINSNNVAVNTAIAYDGITGSSQFQLRTSSANPLLFGTNNTERARIDSSGYMQGTVNGLGAGRIPAKQYYRLDSAFTGTNGTAAQPIYGVGVTLIGSTVYEFEAIYAFSRSTGSTSHTMSFLFGGTATINNIFYTGVGPGEGILPPLSTYDGGPASFAATSAGASVATAAMTIGTGIFYIVKGTVSINAGGTFIPQYQLSAAPGGAYSTYAGAYFSIWPLAASGAAVNIGSWA